MPSTSFRTTVPFASLLVTGFNLVQALPTIIKPLDSTKFYLPISVRWSTQTLSDTTEEQGVSHKVAARSANPSDPKPNGGNNVGAIIGGTIATGVVIVIFVFVLFAIRRQVLIRRRRKDEAEARTKPTTNAASIRTPPEGLKEVVKKQSHRTRCLPSVPPSTLPQRTSNHDARTIYPESIYSQIPDSADSTKVQFGVLGDWDETTVPSKAAHFLGLQERSVIRVPVPPPSHQPPPRLTKDFDVPIPGPSRRRGSTCSLSTLGMELLHDTMQSPKPERFDKSPLSGIWKQREAGRKPVEPTPAKNGRCPSRVCFLPEFSATSSKANSAIYQTISPETMGDDGKKVGKVVRRETVRKDMFQLGENKF